MTNIVALPTAKPAPAAKRPSRRVVQVRMPLQDADQADSNLKLLINYAQAARHSLGKSVRAGEPEQGVSMAACLLGQASKLMNAKDVTQAAEIAANVGGLLAG